MPLVTVVRLMGAMNRRLNPKSVSPGIDSTSDGDATGVSILEKKIKESRK